MPLVSVIMPSYNHAKFIDAAIQSILDQTFQDYEIVITDDCSTDNSIEKIKKFTDPRIRLFHFAVNQGAASAANNSIREAQGKYIALLNSDDVFVPDRLEKQVRYLEEHPEIGAVFGQIELIDEEGRILDDKSHLYNTLFLQDNRSRQEWLRYFFYHGNCLCHPTMMIRRACYDSVGLYDERMAGLPDFDLWVRLTMKYEINILPDVLLRFRLLNREMNASAPRPDVLIGGEIERIQVLKRFLAIPDIDTFERIFPQVKGQLAVGWENLIPYVLAKLAIEVKLPGHQYFAIDTMFTLLADERLASRIREKFDYTYSDLIVDARRYDIFNLYPNYSLLYVDTGAGFNEGQMLSQKVNIDANSFRIKYSLSNFENVKALKWYPVLKPFCSIEIREIRLKNSRDSVIPLNLLTSEGYQSGSSLVFENRVPEIRFPVNGEYNEIIFEGNWDIWKLQQTCLWVDEKLEELAQKREELAQFRSIGLFVWVIKVLYQSQSWQARLLRKVISLLRKLLHSK